LNSSDAEKIRCIYIFLFYLMYTKVEVHKFGFCQIKLGKNHR